jgi:hypothetical protein
MYMIHSSPPLIRSLPQQETPLNWSDFTCIEIVKCYFIIPHKGDHPSYMDTFALQEEWCYERGDYSAGKIYQICLKLHTYCTRQEKHVTW